MTVYCVLAVSLPLLLFWDNVASVTMIYKLGGKKSTYSETDPVFPLGTILYLGTSAQETVNVAHANQVGYWIPKRAKRHINAGPRRIRGEGKI